MAASAGDIYEVVVPYGHSVGSAAINTFGFIAKGSVSGNAQDDLAQAFKTAVVKNTSGGLLYKVTSEYNISRLDVIDVHPGLLATYELTFATVTGAMTPDTLPPQCAALFSMRTSLKGRSFRGRFYLPGLNEASQAGGTWIGSIVTDLTTLATQLLAVFGPSGSNANWQLCVISRQNGGVIRPTPVGTTVTSIAVDPIVRTQRRRVSGVGS